MTKTIVEKTFDRVAKDYDRIKIQIIPGYTEVEALIWRYVGMADTRRATILELGTGTGRWASQVLRQLPRAQYHGVDFSEEMLRVASHRLKKFGDRVTLQKLDLNAGKPKGRYDLIYSAFTIHHIEDKRNLFKMLRRVLKPGGSFLYVDITIASSRDLEALFVEGWKRFMRSSAWPNRKIRPIIEDHLENDIPETAQTQLEFLRDAEFSSCDVIWRHEKFAAFHAMK